LQRFNDNNRSTAGVQADCLSGRQRAHGRHPGLKGPCASHSRQSSPQIGSTVDEPETLIVPVTAGADGAVPLDAAVVGAAALGAVLGAVDAAPFEHAPKAMVASNASAPMRRDVVMVTRCSS